MRAVRSGFLVGIAVSALIAASPASAQADKSVTFDLPAQSLTEALRKVAREGGLEFSAPADPLRGKRSRPLKGNFTVEEAARRLLDGTHLHAEITEGALIVRAAPATIADGRRGNGGDEIVVTGSRVEGGQSASPSIIIKAEEIQLAGQTNVGEAMRSLPQNFSGGQNPGVMRGTTGQGNLNTSSGSSPNLRGLGGDATLTLMNGHRLSYGSTVQAVDVSAIPLAAVDRVDIVPDGASAIYGSDAVGGVVNIILKRDYDGASLLARWGGATSGGNFQQQYSAVAGKTWQGGGIITAISYDDNSPIYSHDRNFTRYMPDANTLYPRIEQTNAVISGHHLFGELAEFSIDATYSHRDSFQSLQQIDGYIYENRPKTTAYSVSPSIKIGLAPAWHLNLSGTYGSSDTHFDQLGLYNVSQTSRISGCYCNELAYAETYLSGRLSGIMKNPIALVFGGGYRYNHFSSVRYSASRADSKGSVESYYGFSELSLPFVEPGQGGSLIYRLSASAALRYERYPGLDSVAVPKIGILYGLSPSVDIKGTWGKSFKAPLLDNLRASSYAQVYEAAIFGGQRFPTGSTMIVDSGGNPNLKPEKATSWSVSLAFHPETIENFKAQATYFNVKYKNRVVEPVAGAAIYQALSNPDYDQFITYNPSLAEASQVIANADLFYNYAGPNGLSNVVAILHNRFTNASRQDINGIDLSLDYRIDIGAQSSVQLNANGAWLWSKQKLTESSATVDMAGTIFNAPRFKARASIGWTDQTITSTLYVNHVSGSEDTRSTPSLGISSQTTFDASIRYRLPQKSGVLNQLSILLNVQNMFNQRPPAITPTNGILDYVNYDSTNFSPIGRFISLTVSKDL